MDHEVENKRSPGLEYDRPTVRLRPVIHVDHVARNPGGSLSEVGDEFDARR